MTDKSEIKPRRRLTARRLGVYFFIGMLVMLCLGAVDDVVFPLLACACFVCGWALIFGGVSIPRRMWPWINRDARALERGPVTLPVETRVFRYRPFGCFATGVLTGCALVELTLGAGSFFVKGLDWRVKATLGSMLLLLGLWMAVYFSRLPRTFIRTGPEGICFREAFVARTIRWDEVTALESSDIRSAGNGVFTSLLRVHTPERYIRIDMKIMALDELMGIIQQATGLDWK